MATISFTNLIIAVLTVSCVCVIEFFTTNDTDEDYEFAYNSGVTSLQLRLKVWDRIASELGID